ncbi:hypothetical protein [Amycolatopsis pigmentata]|uniref:WXG100 family type VII secretion target n=1 Tax=Amycolatopsis pigmentata TaxID=450801 RepID=A0ABW5G0M3_9PSEU
MADDFYLDPAGLSHATRGLRDANERLSEAFSKLSEVTERHEGCWGTDDIGKTFDKKYRDPAEKAKENIKKTVEGTDSLTENLDEASESFQELDRQSAKQMDDALGQQMS